MSLIDEIRAAQRNNTCRVEQILAGMEDCEAEELRQALTDPVLYHTTISAVLTRRGWQISEHVISKHRRGECTCAKN